MLKTKSKIKLKSKFQISIKKNGTPITVQFLSDYLHDNKMTNYRFSIESQLGIIKSLRIRNRKRLNTLVILEGKTKKYIISKKLILVIDGQYIPCMLLSDYAKKLGVTKQNIEMKIKFMNIIEIKCNKKKRGNYNHITLIDLR